MEKNNAEQIASLVGQISSMMKDNGQPGAQDLNNLNPE